MLRSPYKLTTCLAQVARRPVLATQSRSAHTAAYPAALAAIAIQCRAGAANLIMQKVVELIVPKFLGLLEFDYRRWLNGSRDHDSVGSLIEAVWPSDVLRCISPRFAPAARNVIVSSWCSRFPHSTLLLVQDSVIVVAGNEATRQS